MDFYLLLPSLLWVEEHDRAEARRCTISSQGIKSRRSGVPEHSHDFIDTHIMMVEITKPRKCESWEPKAHCGSFQWCSPLEHSHNLSSVPVGSEERVAASPSQSKDSNMLLEVGLGAKHWQPSHQSSGELQLWIQNGGCMLGEQPVSHTPTLRVYHTLRYAWVWTLVFGVNRACTFRHHRGHSATRESPPSLL